MSISKRFMGKVAVAAVAVVGVVGTVWGQASPIPATNRPTVSGTTAGTMTVLYNVPEIVTKVEFEPAANTPFSGDALVKFDVLDTLEHKADGNTGTIKVKTGYSKWDIELKTANNGVLRLNGAAAGAALRKSSNTDKLDTARLGIQIGIMKDDGSAGAALRTAVDSGWVKNSKTAPVAFSQILTKLLTAPNVTDTAGISKSLGGRGLYRAATSNVIGEESVKYQGFGPAGAVTDSTITFVVNTGLGIDPTKTTKLNGNVSGNYVDTLKFTFIAGY
jgi:hypothetical protein